MLTETPAATATRLARPAGRTEVLLLLAPVTWGALLFGAVYPWAYIPLLAAITLAGVYGWAGATPADRDPARSFAAALLLTALVPVIQLVPLPGTVLMRAHPALDTLLRRFDFPYAFARDLGQPVMHPLSIAPEATMRGLAFLIALGVFAAGCIVLLPKARIGLLVRSLATLGAALAVFGIVQRATFNQRIYWIWEPINVASNAFGPFVNRNHFAGWMLMTAPLTAGYLVGLIATERGSWPASWRARAAWLSSPRASRIMLLAGALGVMVLATVWTLSRSGIAGMAAAGALLAVCAATRLGGTTRIAGAGVLLAMLALGVAWRGAGEVAEWYSRTNTLAWRLDLWSDTQPILREFWLTGTGLNTYGVSTRLYPMSDPAWHAMEAHNDYLQVVSEGGVLLTIAALATLVVLVRGIRRALAERQSPQLYWIRVGAVVGLIAIGIQEAVDFSLQMPGNAVLFTLLVAIALHRGPSYASV